MKNATVWPKITQVMLRNRIPWTQSRDPGVLLVFNSFCPLLYIENASNILIGIPVREKIFQFKRIYLEGNDTCIDDYKCLSI